MNKLNQIRQPKKAKSVFTRFLFPVLAFLLGILLGYLSKLLDVTADNDLPRLLQTIDITNLFGRVGVWALIAVILAVFSCSPMRAALHAFVFFAGMLLSYDLSSKLLGGFWMDAAYLMIWVVWMLASAPLAFVIWYARGKGAAALGLSSFVIAFFFLQAFDFSLSFEYFGVCNQGVEIIFWLASVAVLYTGLRRTATAVVFSLPIAYLLLLVRSALPFSLPF